MILKIGSRYEDPSTRDFTVAPESESEVEQEPESGGGAMLEARGQPEDFFGFELWLELVQWHGLCDFATSASN